MASKKASKSTTTARPKKRVILVHGWSGHARNHFFPSVKTALTAKGYKVIAVKQIDSDTPKIKPWVAQLQEAVGTIDAETYFVGHSIGCQVIIRYLAQQKKRCGGAVFVGGWFQLMPDATPTADDRRIAKPWLFDPIDFAAVKKNLATSVAILSDDDPFVPLAPNKAVFTNVLKSKVIVERKKGHFTKEDGVTAMPSVVKELLAMGK
jgi:uncharacterized protein